jgi:hypothetical protein
MKSKARQQEVNGELYELRKDFKDLTLDGKRGVLKTAKGLLKVQKSSFAYSPVAPAPPNEAEKGLG